jgi:hypothetical protein
MRRCVELAAAAGIGLLAGCAAPPAAPRPAAVAPPRPVVLAKFERRLADGRLEVAARLRNPGPAAVTAQVNCDFQGGDGRSLAAAPEALSVSLAPGEILTVHFDAATPAAAEGIVFVRPD